MLLNGRPPPASGQLTMMSGQQTITSGQPIMMSGQQTTLSGRNLIWNKAEQIKWVFESEIS